MMRSELKINGILKEGGSLRVCSLKKKNYISNHDGPIQSQKIIILLKRKYPVKHDILIVIKIN